MPEFSGIDSSMRSTRPFSAEPLKMPSISESPRPSGFPKATTGEPGCGARAAIRSGRAELPSICSSARSFTRSKLSSRAGNRPLPFLARSW
jgi:hypothetical protein